MRHRAMRRQSTIWSAAPDERVFRPEIRQKMAGPDRQAVPCPSWPGFVDVAHFRAAEDAGGSVEGEDPGLEEPRRAWREEE
jgi:hypothetical protein